MNRKLKMTCEQLNQIVTLAKDNEGLDIELLAEAMGLTVEEEEKKETVKVEKIEEKKVERKTDSQKAYDDTLDWIFDNRDYFTGRSDKIYGEVIDDYVFVIHSVLFKFMEENGYSSRAILSEWAKDGLVRVYPETSINEYNRHYSRRRMGLNGRMIRCICLRITPKLTAALAVPEPKQVEKPRKKTASQEAYDDTLRWIADNRDGFTAEERGRVKRILGEITDKGVFIIMRALGLFLHANKYLAEVILADWGRDGLIETYTEANSSRTRYLVSRRLGGEERNCVFLKVTPELTAALNFSVPEPKQVELDTDRPNHWKPWAQHEVDLVQEELIKFGKPRNVPQESIEALSELTGRTEKAVLSKLYQLRKTLTGETSAWTTGEENKLISLYEGTGIPIRTIGKELGRSEQAINKRITKLRGEGRITTYRVAPIGVSNENRNQNK